MEVLRSWPPSLRNATPVLTSEALGSHHMRWLKRFFWLFAWGAWAWLGFGLYRELPRSLGSLVSTSSRVFASQFSKDTYSSATNGIQTLNKRSPELSAST
jgi:hypothetical protein